MISMIISEIKPPQSDRVKAVIPLINRTNTDFSSVIENVFFKSSFIIENIITILASPGFAPSGSGRGITLSIYDIPHAIASKIPDRAIQ